MTNAVRELRDRHKREEAQGHRLNSITMLCIGILDALFATYSVGSVVAILLGFEPPVFDKSLVFAILFSLFWTVLAVAFLTVAARGFRRVARAKRMREGGQRGTATILSYELSSWYVNHRRRTKLRLSVQVPKLEPYEVDVTDYPITDSAVTTGALLTVFVDPTNPSDVFVDWWER